MVVYKKCSTLYNGSETKNVRDKIIVKWKIAQPVIRSQSQSQRMCERNRDTKKSGCIESESRIFSCIKMLHDLHQIFLSIKCCYKIFYRIIKFNDKIFTMLTIIFPVQSTCSKFNASHLSMWHDMQFLRFDENDYNFLPFKGAQWPLNPITQWYFIDFEQSRKVVKIWKFLP